MTYGHQAGGGMRRRLAAALLGRDGATGAAGAAGAPEQPGRPRGWAAPHLLGGRGRAEMSIAAVLIIAGGLTDTVAFKTTLDLLFPQQSDRLSWIMAVGATSMALVAAASLGITLAVRRRTDGEATRAMVAAAAVVWITLGLAMFLVRCFVGSGCASAVFSSQSCGVQHPALGALFFGAIYLISGACTIFEAERLYNPDYFAYRRLGRLLRKHARLAAVATAEADRARSAVGHYAGELDRETHRRTAAIAERQALGAQAANYARVLMATHMKDPAKTGITETGPTPRMPDPPDQDDAAAGSAA